MFLLRDLRFVLCSRDLDVQKRAKDYSFFYLNYPEINEVGKLIDVDTTLGRIKGHVTYPPLNAILGTL